MADNSKLTEHQALGEALGMLRSLMMSLVVDGDMDRAMEVLERYEGKPAVWLRCWKEAQHE